jgi:hypothetical protein
MANVNIGGDALKETTLVKNFIIKGRCEGITIS